MFNRLEWKHMEIGSEGIWQCKPDFLNAQGEFAHPNSCDYGATDGVRATHEYDLRNRITYGEGLTSAGDAGNGWTESIHGIVYQGNVEGAMGHGVHADFDGTSAGGPGSVYG